MADSSAFNYYFGGVTGMGNPATEAQEPANPYDPRKENELLPWIMTNMETQRKKQEDPARLREQMQVYKEFRAEEAQQANKMALQRQLLAEIPAAIRSYGQAAAQFAYNAPRLEILARVPDQIRAAYGAFGNINVPRSRGFS